MNKIKEKIDEFKEIQILIFNLMGIRLGLDTEQIHEMLKPDQVRKKKLNVFPFHENIHFLGIRTIYKSPMVLLLKEKKITAGIIIDQPEGIIPITIDSIQPLPYLIEATNWSSAIWGVTLRNEKVIFLIDFYKLLAY